MARPPRKPPHRLHVYSVLAAISTINAELNFPNYKLRCLRFHMSFNVVGIAYCIIAKVTTDTTVDPRLTKASKEKGNAQYPQETDVYSYSADNNFMKSLFRRMLCGVTQATNSIDTRVKL